MIDILEVVWRDNEDDEFSVIQRRDGEGYVISCNGQGHIPVNLPNILRQLADRYERQTHTAEAEG